MTLAHRHHDISDRVWRLLEPNFPNHQRTLGGIAYGNRLFISTVFRIMHT